MHYLLFYDVVPDYALKRVPYREEHLNYAQRAVERGELVLGGALADPIDGAVLLFRAPAPNVVAEFAQGDPYVRHGVVTTWRIRAWTTVVGNAAEAKVPLLTTPASTTPASASVSVSETEGQ